MGDNDKFEWFPADTADPLRKYKQPKPNTTDLSFKTASGQSSGYPQEGIDNDNIMVKGRWPSDTKKKTLMDIRGKGAATKGFKFHSDD